ncbi:hypothetical protein CW696_09570, partial [ANME-2 cluster archaeon]
MVLTCGMVGIAGITDQGCTRFDASGMKNISVTSITDGNPVDAPILLKDCGRSNPEPADPHGIPVRYVDVHAPDIYEETEISIRYSDADLDGLDETRLVIEHYSNGTWTQIDSAVDAANNTVIATTSLLPASTFVLVYNGTSVNTKKSIYHTGEVAEITIVVLDHAGKPVRNAAIEMAVDAPDGMHYYSTVNRTIVPAGRDGVYEAYHNTTVEGMYNITCAAVIDCNMSYFNTYFMVRSEY